MFFPPNPGQNSAQKSGHKSGGSLNNRRKRLVFCSFPVHSFDDKSIDLGPEVVARGRLERRVVGGWVGERQALKKQR